MPSARDLIRQEYGDSRNLFTPHIIRYGFLARPRFAYELSWGESITGGRLYGVSVVESIEDQTRRRCDLSASFHSLAEAEAYIQALRRELRYQSIQSTCGQKGGL